MLNPHHYRDVRPVYTIDGRDRIVFANAAWRAFIAPTLPCVASMQRRDPAETRSHVGTIGPEMLGRPIWDFVPEGVARQLWAVLYTRIRAIGACLFVPMRADTAGERRLIDIELRPLIDGSIRHICEPVWSEPRAAVALLDPSYPRDERTLRSCAWCNRIQVRLGAWDEIEQALPQLGIEAAETLPKLLPDVCTSCKQSLLKSFPACVA